MCLILDNLALYSFVSEWDPLSWSETPEVLIFKVARGLIAELQKECSTPAFKPKAFLITMIFINKQIKGDVKGENIFIQSSKCSLNSFFL